MCSIKKNTVMILKKIKVIAKKILTYFKSTYLAYKLI